MKLMALIKAPDADCAIELDKAMLETFMTGVEYRVSQVRFTNVNLRQGVVR